MQPAGENHTAGNGQPVKHKSAHHNTADGKSQYIRQHEEIDHSTCEAEWSIATFPNAFPPFPVDSVVEEKKCGHQDAQPFMSFLSCQNFSHQDGEQDD